MIEQQELPQQIQKMIEKANRSLRAARGHLVSGDADFASSKAYYAVFHMMQAALLTKEKTYSKHAGVISGFSEHFIKPKIFPTDYGELIQRLRRDRELGDYSYQLTLSTDEAGRDIEGAAKIVDSIEKYLESFLGKQTPAKSG
jgi:uncharacterized protein (UPF0332 family)